MLSLKKQYFEKNCYSDKAAESYDHDRKIPQQIFGQSDIFFRKRSIKQMHPTFKAQDSSDVQVAIDS